MYRPLSDAGSYIEQRASQCSYISHAKVREATGALIRNHLAPLLDYIAVQITELRLILDDIPVRISGNHFALAGMLKNFRQWPAVNRGLHPREILQLYVNLAVADCWNIERYTKLVLGCFYCSMFYCFSWR